MRLGELRRYFFSKNISCTKVPDAGNLYVRCAPYCLPLTACDAEEKARIMYEGFVEIELKFKRSPLLPIATLATNLSISFSNATFLTRSYSDDFPTVR
jgi:hypothetical protein